MTCYKRRDAQILLLAARWLWSVCRMQSTAAFAVVCRAPSLRQPFSPPYRDGLSCPWRAPRFSMARGPAAAQMQWWQRVRDLQLVQIRSHVCEVPWRPSADCEGLTFVMLVCGSSFKDSASPAAALWP